MTQRVSPTKKTFVENKPHFILSKIGSIVITVDDCVFCMWLSCGGCIVMIKFRGAGPSGGLLIFARTEDMIAQAKSS